MIRYDTMRGIGRLTCLTPMTYIGEVWMIYDTIRYDTIPCEGVDISTYMVDAHDKHRRRVGALGRGGDNHLFGAYQPSNNVHAQAFVDGDAISVLS
eukprot:1370774-Amorphochlora_amoeboformis.AAC.1